jgi:hypothetical protein
MINYEGGIKIVGERERERERNMHVIMKKSRGRESM